MKKLAELLAGRGLVVALVLAALVGGGLVALQRTFAPSSQQAQAAAAVPNSSATPTSGTATSTPTPAATANGLTQPQLQLITQVSKFLQAYYYLGPKDTEASRRQRIVSTRLVPANVLGKLSLGLATGTEADNARIQAGYTLVATVVPNSFDAEEIVDDDPNTLSVTVSVTVDQHWPDGRVVTGANQPTTTTWNYHDNAWRVLTFTEGGDIG